MRRRRSVSDRWLTGLADGSLPADERAEAEQRVAHLPELRERVVVQRHALQALERARSEGAPGALRARISLASDPARRRAAPAPNRPAVALGGLVAAVVAVVALALSGTSGGPTVAQAAALSWRPAQTGLTATSPGSSALPSPRVAGLSFPYWGDGLGLEPVGTRQDQLDGRSAVTVFYAGRGTRVGYTIISGAPLRLGSPSRTASVGGIPIWITHLGDRTVVSWRRGGHTCVLSAPAPASLLGRLVAFRHGGISGY